MSDSSLPKIYVAGYMEDTAPRFISTLAGVVQSSISQEYTFCPIPNGKKVILVSRQLHRYERLSVAVGPNDGIIMIYYPNMSGQPEAVEAELNSLDSPDFLGPIAILPMFFGKKPNLSKSTYENLKKLKWFDPMATLDKPNAIKVGLILFVVSIHMGSTFLF
jgi:hypothetical protein